MSTGLPTISPVTPSERSVRSSGSAALQRPPSVQGSNKIAAGSGASQRSVAPTGSQRAGVPPIAPSERSHRSQGSNRSITSSVALGKLAQLEHMLLEERSARESAENTMLQLQRERIVRDEASRRQAALEKQLETVMAAVKGVVADPDNPSNTRRLKAVLTGGQTSSAASERDAVNSEGRQRSFLDGVGQYEREREKARKAAKADLANRKVPQ
jgi:hypothetical protein